MRRMIGLMAALLMVACDGGGGGGKSAAEIKAEWDEHCETRAMCPDGREAEACKAEYTCLSKMLRTDMLEKTVACEADRMCNEGDDACYSLDAQGLTPSTAGQKFQDDCLARRAACEAAGTPGPADDFCIGTPIMNDSAIAVFAPCLTGACEGIEACLEGKFVEAVPECAQGE